METQEAQAKQFRIELISADRGLVFARQLDHSDFQLTPHSQLKGCVVNQVDLPRKISASGTPDLDIFGFFLKNASDAVQFRVGETVGFQNPASAK